MEKKIWDIYESQWEGQKKEEVKIGIFLHLIGDEVADVLTTFDKEVTVLAKFDKYFTPNLYTTKEAFMFINIIQSEGQPFDSFYKELKCRQQNLILPAKVVRLVMAKYYLKTVL